MKTQNFKNSIKAIAAAVITVVSLNIANAQSTSKNAVLPLIYNTTEGVIMEPQELVNNNSDEIRNWLNSELEKEVKGCDFAIGNIVSKISIEVDKQGNITNYKVNGDNLELTWILESILDSAPAFEPSNMNGCPSKMLYEIPVSINIR